MFQKPDPKQSFPKLEESILEYWRENKTFEKSIEKNKGKLEWYKKISKWSTPF